MKKIKFTKMVGAGNDFIIIENVNTNLPGLARSICQRKTGIGADGMLILDKIKGSQARMRIFNPDGSEAEMCGNGIRCCAVYMTKRKKLKKKQLTFFTKAGILYAECRRDTAKVKMSYPKDLKLDILLDIEPRPVVGNYIDTGVPHVVIFVEGLHTINVKEIGRRIRNHRKFSPRGANVNFVEIIDKNKIKVRTYERGVENETLACGTGAVASSIVTFFKTVDSTRDKKNIKVNATTLSTDTLLVTFDFMNKKISNVWLEGEANSIYKGEYYV
ncbi:diaminopimelate epimerase [Candidatus Omnitrophota bacterium]